MWYNIGRWAMLLDNPKCDPEQIRLSKSEALKAIGTIAFTNINKVRGNASSKDEYYTLAYMDISGELLRKETEIIKPKVIICCGTYNEVMHHAPQYKNITIRMPHPGARISTKKMLHRLLDSV